MGSTFCAESAIERDVPLAPRTTLELGGAASHFLEASDESEVMAGLRFAAERGLPVLVLGGGSNVVVSDAGFPGLVIELAMREVAFTGERGLSLKAAGGADWDRVVAQSVARGLSGLECLSGIPGRVGATPIQNVGAYGQEVAQTIESVVAIDRQRMERVELDNERCEFSYRDSRFKRAPGRYVVLSVRFTLRDDGKPTLRYDELRRALGGGAPTLAQARSAVLSLRRGKSMVIDPGDENRRSAGSFFTNPVVDEATAEAVVERALREGAVASAQDVPRYPAGPGRQKLAAGFLIEHAGCSKGMRHGNFGLSSRHALAIVHHGGGSTAELVAFARTIRDRVEDRFGVRLVPEPVFAGFPAGFAL